MSMNVRGTVTINANIAASPIGTVPPGANTRDATSAAGSVSIASGTGANQAERVYRAEVSVEVGSPVSIDLQSLTNAFGEAISFGSVKALIVENIEGTPGTLTLDPGASNGWTSAVSADLIMPPNARLGLSCPSATGWTVTASNKVLRFTASGEDCPNVRIIITGNASA